MDVPVPVTDLELLHRSTERNALLVLVMRRLAMRYHYTHAQRVKEPATTCPDPGCRMAWLTIDKLPGAGAAYRAAVDD